MKICVPETPDAFREWCRKNERPCIVNNCPIANYLMDNGATRSSVGFTKYFDGENYIELPTWAQCFIDRVDERKGLTWSEPYSPADCLPFLEGLK